MGATGERYFPFELEHRERRCWQSLCPHRTSELSQYVVESGLSWWFRGNESIWQTGDTGSIPGLERSPGEGNGNPFLETWVQSPGWEDLLEKEMVNPLQYSCLEKSHGQRNLVGYSPWGHKELDMTEQLHLHFPVFLPGKSHGERSLASYSSWSHKELDTTWQLNNNMVESKSKSYNLKHSLNHWSPNASAKLIYTNFYLSYLLAIKWVLIGTRNIINFSHSPLQYLFHEPKSCRGSIKHQGSPRIPNSR